MDDLLSMAQAAREIGLTRQAVFQQIKKGAIAYEQYGPHKLLHRDEVIRYKNSPRRCGRPRKKTR